MSAALLRDFIASWIMIHIRALVHNDMPFAMKLKEDAGWNQTEADWRRFLAMQPDGCFVAEWDGRGVGTAATCIFGSVAGIAMVLVNPEFRGRGIGKALMSHALDYLDAQGVTSVRLDATALGKPLYEKLGFVVEYELSRYEGFPKPGVPTNLNLPSAAGRPVQAHSGDWPHLIQLDRDITGADRNKFLSRLFSEEPEAIRVIRSATQVVGFSASRTGTSARQIGPCLGTSEAGLTLMMDAGSQYAGSRVYIDIPIQNHVAIDTAKGLGLSVQRQLVRMRRGQPVVERADHIWASSGPELG
jgi:GNAT superfamily N-acetyltransferase